jgi:hypothetical protein
MVKKSTGAEIAAVLHKSIVGAVCHSFPAIVHDEVKNTIGLFFISKWSLLSGAVLPGLWCCLTTI